MFSFLSKVSSFVLGNVVEEETAQENDSRDSASLGPEQIPQEETTTSNGIRDKVKPGELQKSFYGKVTNLYDGAGVIDHDVYFTFDVILGGFRPELGSEVHVEALRESVSSGWKATRVDHVQEWDAKGQSGTLETVVAKVTDISGNIITLNNELTINMSAMHLGNDTYSPFVGDWIKADLEKFADGSVEIRGVKPLREKHFSGKVAAACPGYGYIDDVYYTIGVCVRGYRPRRGDDVKVTAIESTQGQSKWRAILVEPKPVQSTTQSPSSGTQQFMGERMAELLANKNGIVIKDTLGFGDVAVGDCRTICIDIRNSSQTVHRLVSCCFVRADSQFQVALASDLKEPSESEESRAGTEMRLQPEQTRSVTITFTARALGRFKHLLVIGFEGFEIGRHITGNVVDDHQAYLSPSAPYSRTRKTRQTRDLFADQTDGWLVPGERPTRKVKLIFPIKLKMYTIPSDVRECLLQERDLGMVIPALRQPLCLLNYQARFSALLNAEELQMELEMRQFDLQQVEMEPFREFLCLAVPGLAEGRPSLLIGDTVVVSLCMSARDAPRYEGYIHEVRKDDILLKFNDEFHSSYGLERCDVMFFFNRSSIRRAHQAVEFSVQMGEEVLFPRSLSPKLPIVSLMFGSMETQDEKQVYMNPNNIDKGKELTMPKPTDCLYNSRLNERQRAAVARILSGQSRPTPYLLFGPPGTGKTVTLVEAMLQVFHRVPSSRVIACAPSNSAADLMAVRLHRSGFIQEGDMIRLNAFQRVQEIPESINKYCVDTDSLQLAAHYRIIVCTCSTAGQLFSLGLKPGHFTHVFVDEAGQATEPECLIPIGLAAGEDGQIILAGDPFQLGPVLRSPVAISYGLNVSLLERLMSGLLYARDETRFVDHGCYDPLLVTKLVNNYRSHPSLLRLPSALFYHSELRVCAERTMREQLSQWEMLPTQGTPLVFHGLKGEDMREGNSPSWFNPVEAVQVVRYVQALKNSATCPIKLADLGIITPYKKQVEKIRLLLSRVGIDEVKVGSVEEFQGQERPAIIISTVRSTEAMVGFDVAHTIGFLDNPKRFNVAVTRAQSLLVVVGNPHVLCRDPYWCSLLQYCVMVDAYTGCDLPDLDTPTYQEEFMFSMGVLSNLTFNDEKGTDQAYSGNGKTENLNEHLNTTKPKLQANTPIMSGPSKQREQRSSSATAKRRGNTGRKHTQRPRDERKENDTRVKGIDDVAKEKKPAMSPPGGIVFQDSTPLSNDAGFPVATRDNVTHDSKLALTLRLSTSSAVSSDDEDLEEFLIT